MRWPLRWQFFTLTVGVLLCTLAAVSALQAWFSARQARQTIESQLRDVVRVLSDSSFPLTDAVLRQTQGLAGAHFVAATPSGKVFAASQPELAPPPAGQPGEAAAAPDELRLRGPIDTPQGPQLYATVTMQRLARREEPFLLHIYFPEDRFRAAWRQAVLPPLVGAVAALALAGLASAIVAGRVTRPVAQLREQVTRIAAGDYTPLPLSSRNDEIRDLAQAVNRTAAMLARYEDEVRRSERLRALGQLGAGVAHQMRNAVTGCRIALDLHRREQALGESGSEAESLEVAGRQLALMESYLQRFLTLGVRRAPAAETVDLAEMAAGVLSLVLPTARHVQVDLQFDRPEEPPLVAGDADALAQMLTNLLLNAIEATAQAHARQGAPQRPQVVLKVGSLARAAGERALLEVRDNGAGPAEAIGDALFEPLVSDKPEGAGLGLAVARDVVQQHGGQIHWERRGEWTCFLVELPAVAAGALAVPES